MKRPNSRRDFLTKLGFGSIGVMYTSRIFSNYKMDSDLRKQTYRFLVPPYLQAITDSRATIMAIASSNSYMWVEYGIDGISEKAHTVKDGLVEANNTLAKVKIDNLEPNTTYQYRIHAKEIVTFDPYKIEYGREIVSDIFTFKTLDPNGEKFSCLILNDIHDRPSSYSQLLKNYNVNDYDFVSLNGDSFDYQTDRQQIIDHLLTPCTSLFASNTPMIMNRGNHETRGRLARDFKEYFDFPEDKFYQAFRQGPVHVIHLDTGEDKPDDAPVYAGLVDFDRYRIEQQAWLEEVVKTREFRKAKYRAVIMHIPPFHSGDWHGTMHCRELFDPIFKKHKIDVVISGHTHKHGLHLPDQDHSYPIVISGGPKEGQKTMVDIVLKDDKLNINLRRENGEILETLSID